MLIGRGRAGTRRPAGGSESWPFPVGEKKIVYKLHIRPIFACDMAWSLLRTFTPAVQRRCLEAVAV